MNSLVRRMKDKNDVEKIYEVIRVAYAAGRTHKTMGLLSQERGYVKGRVRDLVALLGLKFDADGDIDWHKIINEKELYART